ncbi:MAG: hypothetical protein M1120_01190 [Patescibacteria group bacterium]|nr:hypothetical protein [Patescibacteria group bacterium]
MAPEIDIGGKTVQINGDIQTECVVGDEAEIHIGASDEDAVQKLTALRGQEITRIASDDKGKVNGNDQKDTYGHLNRKRVLGWATTHWHGHI